jgi:hypothetical protein
MKNFILLIICFTISLSLSAQNNHAKMCIWNNGKYSNVWVAHVDSITFVEESIQDIFGYSYTQANNGAICEYSSDNVIDNNVPNPKTGYTNTIDALCEMYNEIFAWQPVTSDDYHDSPMYIWESNYQAIISANQILGLIEDSDSNADVEKAEALLIRAYHHFLLVNIFCHAWKNEYDSKQDLGIPYVYDVEYSMSMFKERSTVYDTYMAIQTDLEEGLKLLSESHNSLPATRFNSKAAHAFAARFYLYKREWEKVIEHANQVLTTNDDVTLAMLFDAQTNRDQSNIASAFNHYINPNAPSNLLVYNTYSTAPYAHFPTYGRYQYNGEAQDFTTYGAGPCWRSQFPGVSIWSADQKLGGFVAKDYYWFEYVDTVNGFGYIRGVTRAFTTNETLLCRAEAKVHLYDIEGATNDLRLWCQSYNVNGRMDTLANGNVNLTKDNITSFYTSNTGTPFSPILHNQDIYRYWIITPEQLPFVHCLLHFRRIETLHDGLRWHDLKRYGIEITHVQGKDTPRVLVWNDDRRAIQLPQEIINAGLLPNPRKVLGDNIEASTVSSINKRMGSPKNPTTQEILKTISEYVFTIK